MIQFILMPVCVPTASGNQSEWWKILATALISSFLTALLTEPLKGWVAVRFKRSQILYSVATEAGGVGP